MENPTVDWITTAFKNFYKCKCNVDVKVFWNPLVLCFLFACAGWKRKTTVEAKSGMSSIKHSRWYIQRRAFVENKKFINECTQLLRKNVVGVVFVNKLVVM
jgi:hypothetical protein